MSREIHREDARTNLRVKYDIVNKKACFIRLHLRDEITEIINHKINVAFVVAYPSAKIDDVV